MADHPFLRALRRQPTDYTPVWLMRQAGRYLPEYNRTRARAGDFMTLCKTPELACEVTLQPLARYALDAAILFSDILTIPDAMGLGLSFAQGEGPRFARPLRTEADVAALAAPDPEIELRYVMDAVRTIRGALADRVPLIGFSGSPWTLACYMIEGAGSSDFRLVKTMLYQRPDLLERILAVTATAVTDYLNAQIAAGAQAVMIFDTWGGVLPGRHYETFSLAWMARIIAGLRAAGPAPRVPTIVFTKGGGQWLERIASSGADAIGIDWTVDPGDARARVGDRVAIQGNLDPMALMGTPASIEAEAIATLDAYDRDAALPPGRGLVFNLGHGINQHTPPENVSVLVDTIHARSRKTMARGASGSSLN
ncbi:MAG: uroporphyrinogen decarboxylase [Lautropia sp.]